MLLLWSGSGNCYFGCCWLGDLDEPESDLQVAGHAGTAGVWLDNKGQNQRMKEERSVSLRGLGACLCLRQLSSLPRWLGCRGWGRSRVNLRQHWGAPKSFPATCPPSVQCSHMSAVSSEVSRHRDTKTKLPPGLGHTAPPTCPTSCCLAFLL